MPAPLTHIVAPEEFGVQVPGYRIIRQIGRQHRASAYLAKQDHASRELVLKIFDKLEGQVSASTGFLEQNRVLASFDHKNVITVFDVGRVDERCFIAMEHLEGGTLAERIGTGMDPGAALDIVEQIGNALDFAHRCGAIHYDVSAENVLFDTVGTPKLTDFGAAYFFQDIRAESPDGGGSGQSVAATTASPDPGGDVRALGKLFFELVTGQKRHAGDFTPELILGDGVVLPSRLVSYQVFFEQLFNQEVELGFQSAGELVGYLRAVEERENESPTARVVGFRGDEMARPFLALKSTGSLRKIAVVGVLAATLVGTAVIWRTGDKPVTADAEPQSTMAHVAPMATPDQSAVGASDVVESVSEILDRIDADVRSTVSEPALSSTKPDNPPTANTVATGDLAERGHSEKDRSVLDAPAKPLALSEAALFRASATPGGDASGIDRPVMLVESVSPANTMIDSESQLSTASSGHFYLTSASPQDGTQIDRWLAAADAAMRDYRLTTPADDSALHYYRMVLDTQPRNPIATQGLETIANRYAALGRHALAAEKADKVETFLARGLSVQPGNSELKRLAKDLKAYKRQLDIARREALAAKLSAEPVVPKTPKNDSPVGAHPSFLDHIE